MRGLQVGPRSALRVAPNPTAAGAAIQLEHPVRSRIRAEIFDVCGRRVRRLSDEIVARGQYEIAWDGLDDTGRRLPRGVYQIRVAAGGEVKIARLTVLR